MALTKQTGPQGRHRATLAAVQHNAIGDEMPVTSLPERGVGAEAAYELISSELLLDGQRPAQPGDVRHDVDAEHSRRG